MSLMTNSIWIDRKKIGVFSSVIEKSSDKCKIMQSIPLWMTSFFSRPEQIMFSESAEVVHCPLCIAHFTFACAAEDLLHSNVYCSAHSVKEIKLLSVWLISSTRYLSTVTTHHTVFVWEHCAARNVMISNAVYSDVTAACGRWGLFIGSNINQTQ
jgi:hypothetical protein